MNKKIFFEKIKHLYEINTPIEKIDFEVENFLQSNPCDIDLLFRLALLVYYVPYADHPQAFKFIDQILKCDNDNAYAILLLTYIYSTSEYIRENLFEKLSKINSNNNDTQAMVEYIKAWYFDQINENKLYESSLLKSIELAPHFVENNFDLGVFYKKIKPSESKKLLNRALNNVVKINSYNLENYDPYDINEFFNERIRGIHITSELYSDIQEELLDL